MSEPRRLSRSFYARDTLLVARDLLGCRLVRLERGRRISGLIVETEAYRGSEDRGSHGKAGFTARNASMWGEAGHAYVYFTYGMHWLLNVVTERQGFPAAVLIRSLVPREGIDLMRARRPARSDGQLSDGPAKLCQALGIDGAQDGCDLCSPTSLLFLEDGERVPDEAVRTGPRVGLNSVPEPWKSLPWNLRVEEPSARRRGTLQSKEVI